VRSGPTSATSGHPDGGYTTSADFLKNFHTDVLEGKKFYKEHIGFIYDYYQNGVSISGTEEPKKSQSEISRYASIMTHDAEKIAKFKKTPSYYLSRIACAAATCAGLYTTYQAIKTRSSSYWGASAGLFGISAVSYSAIAKEDRYLHTRYETMNGLVTRYKAWSNKDNPQ